MGEIPSMIMANKPKSIKKLLLSESSDPWASTRDERTITSEQKREFLETVGNFKEFGKSIYREVDFKALVEQISKIVDFASDFTLKESEGSFDSVIVKRHMKGLSEDAKMFSQTANEMHTLQQRLTATYENMGQVLGKYYDIYEIHENQ